MKNGCKITTTKRIFDLSEMTILVKTLFIIKIMLLSCSIFLIFGCSNSKNSNSRASELKSIKKRLLDTVEPSESGQEYSDSMIRHMVRRHLPNDKTSIDTFKALHKIDCSNSMEFSPYIFSIDSLIKYKQSELTQVSAEIAQLLGVSKCVTSYYSTSKFDSYIFYSDIVEAHRSESIILVIIDRNSNNFRKLLLFSEYGNELGNYVITSVLKKNKTIERSINHNLHYVHGIGKVDSMYLEKELYIIDENGMFDRNSYKIDTSNEINHVFEH